MTTGAVLFDIDGTLIDSNYLHIQAWSEALEKVGRPVDHCRVHRAIGMDSTKLLESLIGDDADGDVGERATRRHSKRYRKLAPRLRKFDGARELLAKVRELGLQVVLATSAKPEELERLLEVLDAERSISAVTSAEDVEQAKPEPDLVVVALQKAGVAADQAILIGDTVWDGEAARRAGVRFIGVLSGGIGAAELLAAGAIAVYDNVQQLLDEFATSAIASLAP